MKMKKAAHVWTAYIEERDSGGRCWQFSGGLPKFFLGQNYLTVQARNMEAPIDDDAVVDALAAKDYFFPEEYLQLESIDGIFTGNHSIKRFEDFYMFSNVRELTDNSFFKCAEMKVITLPDSIRRIDRYAFGDGDWHPVVGGFPADKPASILPFRAFLLPSVRNARARISMTLEDMTSIDSIETIDEDGTRRYYDLNGRELQGKPDKGVYIYKGKKYMNK